MPRASPACSALDHQGPKVTAIIELTAPDFAVEGSVTIKRAAYSSVSSQCQHRALGPITEGCAELIAVKAIQSHGSVSHLDGIAVADMSDQPREGDVCTHHFRLQLEAEGKNDSQDDKPQRTPEPPSSCRPTLSAVLIGSPR